MKKKSRLSVSKLPDQVWAREGSKTHRSESRQLLLPWLWQSMTPTSTPTQPLR